MTRAARLVLAACIAALLAHPPGLYAAEAVPTEQDRATNARAVALSEQLRCLVCQNQTIADSNADLAIDLRRQVREQIAAGRTDREILAYMTERYSDFVLYRPPLKPQTVFLWAGPLVLLAVAAIVVVRIVRGRRAAETPVLTNDERARARRLLDDGDPP
jgi:cytochrome c-type biogenesis protein CcmH